MRRASLWLLPLGAALILRLGSSYEPFPSSDALRAVPAAWAAFLSPVSSSDTLARTLGRQAPLLTAGVRVADAVTDLSTAYWWLTIAVSVGIVAGLFRVIRAVGVQGFLLPLALAIASDGAVGALAARDPEAPIGAGFGMETLALCLLIWSYDAFVRDRPLRSGGLLGAAALVHPVVLAHGLAALTIAALFTPGARWRRLGLVVLVGLVMGLPAAIQLVRSVIDIGGMEPAAAGRLITDGYLFRYPEAYTLRGLLWEAGLGRILLAAAGVAGAMVLARGPHTTAGRALAGLVAGHAMLTALAVLCYTRRVPGPWTGSLTAYALDLTLTVPLLSILGGAAVMAAVEAGLAPGPDRVVGPPVLRLPLWAAAATLLIWADWTRWTIMATALGLLAFAAVRTGRTGLATAMLAGACIGAFGWSVRRDVRDAALDRDDAELYRWARGTAPDASFIVPPGAAGFRYHARRGVYVDYDLVPVTSPRAMRAWRERLDQVARPDARTGTVPVWRRRYAMDRSFAVANTPERTAALLQRLPADYLVWDARGLAIPPFLPVIRPPDPRLAEVFRNQRYIVFTLAEAGDGRP